MKTNEYNSSDSAAIPNATDLEDPKLPNTLCEELPFPQNAATNEHSRANRQPLSVDGESTNQAWPATHAPTNSSHDANEIFTNTLLDANSIDHCGIGSESLYPNVALNINSLNSDDESSSTLDQPGILFSLLDSPSVYNEAEPRFHGRSGTSQKSKALFSSLENTNQPAISHLRSRLQTDSESLGLEETFGKCPDGGLSSDRYLEDMRFLQNLNPVISPNVPGGGCLEDTSSATQLQHHDANPCEEFQLFYPIYSEHNSTWENGFGSSLPSGFEEGDGESFPDGNAILPHMVWPDVSEQEVQILGCNSQRDVSHDGRLNTQTFTRDKDAPKKLSDISEIHDKSAVRCESFLTWFYSTDENAQTTLPAAQEFLSSTPHGRNKYDLSIASTSDSPLPEPTLDTGGSADGDDPKACTNCLTQASPVWREGSDGQPLCNSCGLFLKLHNDAKPRKLRPEAVRKCRLCSNHASELNSKRAAKLSWPVQGTTKKPKTIRLFPD
ncbi:hypothetical protein V2G26_014764 [Clonostachys chloroleuca]